MEENSKCFIKRNDNTYEEITYKELENRRKSNPDYNQKYFIYVQKMLMEVSHEDYIEYHRERERNRYAKHVTDKLTAFSIEGLNDSNDDTDFNDKDVIEDKDCNVEDDTLKTLEIAALKKALHLLTEVELEIIDLIFYKEKTIRECAEKTGISRSTIHRKKDEILEKLKNLL